MNKTLIMLFTILTLYSAKALAQSDGPRAHLPSPIGVWALNVKYLNLNQNILPSGNLLLKNANINIDVLPITFIHTFSLGKNWARVYAMAAQVLNFTAKQTLTNIPIKQINKNGFSDGFVSFEVGLKGNAAKNIVEFSKTPPSKFSLNGMVRVWYSGSYDANNVVNLGSNRTTFDIGAPMQFWLNNDPKKALWLESWPGIQFFTANNHPAKVSLADQITQRPLFYWENHLSYNFTQKVYAGLDMRIQQGGQTLSDDLKDNNRMSLLAAGIFAGYKILPYVDFYANYAGILTGENNAQSEMIRLSVVVSYINMKKYLPAKQP